ncbi:MAG: sodium-independent anion transporter, partial [Rhodobacter sp.]|nr:sodium-independent anion transporter [Rhodobacter sp.]
DSRVADQSALSAIESMAKRYREEGKELRLRHLSRDCRQLVTQTGLIVEESDDDPDYQTAANYAVRTGLFGESH